MIGLLGGGNKNHVGICAPPLSIGLTRHATTFNQVTVNNYGLLVPAPGTYDGTEIRFRNTRDTLNTMANLEYLPARAGICPLPASGQWWVNAQTNIAAGVSRMTLYDMPSLESMVALMMAMQNSDPSVRIMSPATFATVTAASTVIIAANTSRRTLAITNSGTTDGTTATTSGLYLNFGAAAVVGSGILVPAGLTLIFDSLDGITLQEFRGISTAGNIRVGVEEGI